MNIDSFTADQLLKFTTPEQLYTNDVDTAKKEYRKLSMKWHPDRGGIDQVFQHIKGLYESAEKKFADGLWIIPGIMDFTTVDNKRYQVRYRKHHKFELGDMYISDTIVMYMISKENKDLVGNAQRAVKKFTYANAKMKSEFSRYLPDVRHEAETKDHYVLVYSKTPDLLLLRDVIDMKGELPSVHAAWILSSLYNLACYLKYAGISHNAISPETYFISPQYHSGALLGGWWYSSKFNERMIALPKRTMSHCSSFIKDKKSIDSGIDLQLIRTSGLEMLGDAFGSKLLMKAKADPSKYPPQLLTWLRSPSKMNDPVSQYKTYKELLVACWGPPKFHDLKVTADDLY